MLAGSSNLTLTWNNRESAMVLGEFRSYGGWNAASRGAEDEPFARRQLLNSPRTIALSLLFHRRVGLDEPTNTTTTNFDNGWSAGLRQVAQWRLAALRPACSGTPEEADTACWSMIFHEVAVAARTS